MKLLPIKQQKKKRTNTKEHPRRFSFHILTFDLLEANNNENYQIPFYQKLIEVFLGSDTTKYNFTKAQYFIIQLSGNNYFGNVLFSFSGL